MRTIGFKINLENNIYNFTLCDFFKEILLIYIKM